MLQQKVTANNLANLNTPGYKRFYVTFKKGQAEKLSNTNPRHFSSTAEDIKLKILKDRQTFCRVDGSNVDLDREMLDMVTNQLHYNALTQQVAERYAQWSYIVNEGRR